MYFYTFKFRILYYFLILNLILLNFTFLGCKYSDSISISLNYSGFLCNNSSEIICSKSRCKLNSKFLVNNISGLKACSFVTPSRFNYSFKSSGSLFVRKPFSFDEGAARRSRHMKMVNENISKKRIERKIMKNIVEAVTKTTSEDNKQNRLYKFISDIQQTPTKKRLPKPPEIYSPTYDALLYLKGLPYNSTETQVLDWLKNYEIVSVVLINNENGYFTGDAYVRCPNIRVRDKVATEMEGKHIGGRYIQIFRINENSYMEYYHSGFKKEPKHRNYIDPSILVTTNKEYQRLLNSDVVNEDILENDLKNKKSFINNVKDEVDIGDIKSGMRLVGTVTEIYRNGVIVDCNIFENINGVRHKVFCILKKNRIAKNIGIQGQQNEWLRMKQLILFPGIKLNLYVEKVRNTNAKNTFDKDMWVEHFDESLITTYFDTDKINNLNGISIDENDKITKMYTKSINQQFEQLAGNDFKKNKTKRSLVYLTMDSSVSEDKVLWWEKKILNEVSKRHSTKKIEYNVIRQDLLRTSQKERVSMNKAKVKDVYLGNTIVHGNVPSVFRFESSSTIREDNSEINTNNEKIMQNKNEMNDDTNQDLQHVKSNHESLNTNLELNKLPDDVPIGELLCVNKEYLNDNEFDISLMEHNLNVFDKNQGEKEPPDKIEYLDENFEKYQKLAKQFFGNKDKYGKDIYFHDFCDLSLLDKNLELGFENETEDLNLSIQEELKRDRKINLESFPRLTLFDPAIKVPPNGLILRKSEIPKLSNEHIKTILELLNKEYVDDYEENKSILIDIIKNEGLTTDLLPQTLIQKGLYKVKQSKEYMKNIVKITKDLTGRKFSKEDLDSASTEELEMLVEEALYKFLNWNPSFDVKKQFVTNYGHLLDESLELPLISDVVPKPSFMDSKELEDEGMLENKEDSKGLESNENGIMDPNYEKIKQIEKMWNDMKWLIVIFIYGEQSDLKEIVGQLEKDKGIQKNKNLKHTPMEVESILVQ